MSKEGIIIGAIIAIAIGIIVSIIMTNYFGAFEQLPQSNKTREQLDKIKNTWKITDIISTIGTILIICFAIVLFLKSRIG